MLRAWYMDKDPSNQRTPHHQDPPKYVTLEDLRSLTGVEYFHLNVKTFETDGVLEKIKKDRGYTYEDEIICSKDCLPNYEDKLKIFYTEHLHTDEEIRFCIEGSGYFDVRDKNDEWIRLEITPGDMIILPSGIYHRGTMDFNDYLRVKRFFIGEPVWQAYNRPADNMECRKDYLSKIGGDLQISV